MEKIPGILILTDNRTYGRSTTNNRPLYRCIPNDKNISPVLIPYKINMGFSKVLKNVYILFSMREKTPTLIETIGEIDILENFYEYQLYCRGIKHKQPTFSLSPNITSTSEQKHGKREKYQPFIFTIDNPGTIDYDDAFSIETIPISNHIKITIYIANVPFILTKYNLWQYFSLFQERVASIYLPSKKIPLFPTKVSDLCSLTAGQERPTFSLSFTIDTDTNKVCSHEFHCKTIHISANYVYESADLLSNENYRQLLQTSQTIFNKQIQKSDELVETLMVFMGEKCAEQMDNGIYLLQRKTSRPTLIPIQLSELQESCYVLEKHDKPYMHITSPIRRIVDIVNMAQFIMNMDFSLEPEPLQVYIDNVKENLQQLNSTMKSIKKVQTQCKLYHLFKHQPIHKIYNGILFDKRETKVPEIYSYSVYLTEYKFIATIKTHEQEEENNRFHLYLFHHATTLKQKIKLQIVDPI